MPSLNATVMTLVALFLLCACPRSGGGVLPDDAPPPPQQSAAADQALQAAIQTADSSPKAQAVEAYMSVRRTYPDTTAGHEALYRAGVLYFELGEHAQARKALNELLFENPLFDKANEAKLTLGLSALEMRAYRDAYQTLSSVAQRLEGPQKERALAAAARAAAGAGLFGDALRLAVKEIDQAADEAQRQARLEHLVELVEGRVGFLDVAQVREELSPDHPAWPILTFKLARIHYHLRDWPRLEETLRAFLSRAPQHAFAPQARQLLERASRRTEVKPKVVGAILPMSGRYKALGEAVLRGIQLALQGSELQLIVKDSQGDVNLAGQLVEQLAFDHGAIAILGPLLNEDSRRAALVAEELQVPILTLTRAEGITAIGPHVFRNMLTNSRQAEALADYAVHTLGYQKFAVLYPNVPFGVDLANGFWDRVLALGGEVRGAESYDHDQTTFATEVKKLVGRYYLEDRGDYLEKYREVMAGPGDAFRKRKALEKVRASLDPVVDFDALLIPDSWMRVGLVAPALAVEDIITNACDPRDLEKIRRTTGKRTLKTVTLLGTNTWSSPLGRSGVPELIERGGKFVNCSVYVDGFFAGSARPGTRKFVAAYQAQYAGYQPSLLDAIGHDSAGMLRQLIENQRPQNRAQLTEALSTLQGYEGATGTTHIDPRREAVKPLFFLSVESGGVTEIDPKPKSGT